MTPTPRAGRLGPALLVGLALLGGALPGCAHDVRTRLPGPPAPEAGTLELRFTNAVKHAHLAINGIAVTADAHTRRIVVEGVPAGTATVMLAAGDGGEGGVEKVFSVDLAAGQHLVVPLAAPSSSAGRSLLSAVGAAAVYVGYLALRAAL